jgi:peptide/nickel transport system substrate-binding protein
VGTGPFQLVEFLPTAIVKLKRFDGYKPNTPVYQRTGFGGYKRACVDTVTFRIVTEPAPASPGWSTGELHGGGGRADRLAGRPEATTRRSPPAARELVDDIASPNTRRPPTDNPKFRQAVQAAMDMEEIMEAAHDGNYKLNVGFQYPTSSTTPMPARRPTTRRTVPRQVSCWPEAGYKGEPIVC